MVRILSHSVGIWVFWLCRHFLEWDYFPKYNLCEQHILGLCCILKRDRKSAWKLYEENNNYNERCFYATCLDFLRQRHAIMFGAVKGQA